MANDIDMWNDLENMDKRTKEYNLLCKCYLYRYIAPDIKMAEGYKKLFEKEFDYWGNYY